MVVTEGIRINENGFLSFGDYTSKTKIKVDNFEYKGDIYKIKTSFELTRLEKNGTLFVETVPGVTFHDFTDTPDAVRFDAEAAGDVAFTFELVPDTEYRIMVENVTIGNVSSTSMGKLSFSAVLDGKGSRIEIVKE